MVDLYKISRRQLVRLEIEILAIQHLLYVPCLLSDAVIAVEVHSCMDINTKIAAVKKIV